MPRKKKYLKRPPDAVSRFADTVDMKALSIFLEEQDVPKYQILLGMMLDPAYNRCKFQTLLKKAHISLKDVEAIYSDGMRHLGLLRLMNRLPDLMDDVATDAMSSTTPCPRCDALGFVPMGEETRDCPLCSGKRYIRKMGDKHARDLVFESAKLTHQSSPMVAIQTNIDFGDSKMESMLKRTRAVIMENKKVDSPEPTMLGSGEGETEHA